MVKKVEYWEVNGVKIDTEEDAILYEAELALVAVLKNKDVLAIDYIITITRTNKEVWTAFKEFIGATEHLHAPPPPARIFEVGEVSEAFQDDPRGDPTLVLSEHFKVIPLNEEDRDYERS